MVSSVILETIMWRTGIGRKRRLRDELRAWPQWSKVCPPDPWAWPRQEVCSPAVFSAIPKAEVPYGSRWRPTFGGVLQLQSRDMSCSILCCARDGGMTAWQLLVKASKLQPIDTYMHAWAHTQECDGPEASCSPWSDFLYFL